jgi:hypothetical protein
MKGWFGGFDQVYFPETTLDEVRSDRILLNLTAEQVKQRGTEWTTQPNDMASYRQT